MKTAIYIEEGVQQVVLTPENKFEKDILKSLSEQDSEVVIRNGSFFHCRGGWVRHSEPHIEDQSLLIIKKER